MKPARSHLVLGSILFLAACLLSAGSRLCYTSTFDTATVGLMAVNILRGELPLFFYGQPYFGALEAYLAALYLAVFGFSEFVVSLSPITFTLGWIFFTYLLFSRVDNRRTGLVAAACCAFPGYYVFWYSIATYGGYSALLCIGTALLWLSLLIFQDNPRGARLFFSCLGVGLLTGLGIWIHPLTFPFILLAALILTIYLVRNRFRRDIPVSFAAALVPALAGFLPFYIETGSFLGGISEPGHFSLQWGERALSTLFTVNILELIVWNFSSGYASPYLRFCLRWGPLLFLFCTIPLALFSLLRQWKEKVLSPYWLVPVAWCFLFFTMYVQHHMATIKAPRYTIGLFCFFLSILWGLACSDRLGPVLRKISLSLLFCWLCYQVTGTVLFVAGNYRDARDEQGKMRAVVEAARKNNLRSVQTFGDPFLGLKGQKFSLFSENAIVFANTDLERYQANAQVLETDLGRGYLTTAPYRTRLENTLRALGAAWSMEQVGEYFLFSHVRLAPQVRQRSLLPSEIKASQTSSATSVDASFLLDRCQDAPPNRQDDGEVVYTFSFARVVNLSSLRLFGPLDPAAGGGKGLGPFTVAVSTDGKQYTSVFRSSGTMANGFHAGPGIYIGGLSSREDVLFAPVDARFVTLRFPGKTSFLPSEVFLFETVNGEQGPAPEDLQEMVRIIKEKNVEFVLADRWVSGRLREEFRGSDREEIALPRHTTKYNITPLRYVISPQFAGQSIVCERSLAEECEEILFKQYGPLVISDRYDLENYTFFLLDRVRKKQLRSSRSALLWNGCLPLLTRDMQVLAPWLHSIGYPVWRMDFTKSTGVYHDSWTNGEGRYYGLAYTVDHERDRELILYTHGWRPGSDPDALGLVVLANDELVLPYIEKRGNNYVFSLPETLSRLESLTIRSSTFVPNSRDDRFLGLDVGMLEIR